MEVFLGAQHRAPGGGAAAAVGEGAEDSLAQAIAVAERLAVAKHRRRRAAAAQGLTWLAEPAEAIDAALKAAAAVLPPAFAAPLELDYADAQIGHGGSGHGLDQREQRIIRRQVGSIDAAPAARQGLLQGLQGEGRAHRFAVASRPAERADVFEVDAQQGPGAGQRQQGQVIVVEAEASRGETIPPAGDQVSPVALRNQQLVLNAEFPKYLPLLGGAEAIAWQR